MLILIHDYYYYSYFDIIIVVVIYFLLLLVVCVGERDGGREREMECMWRAEDDFVELVPSSDRSSRVELGSRGLEAGSFTHCPFS